MNLENTSLDEKEPLSSCSSHLREPTWHVISIPYPRVTQEYRSLGVTWIPFRKISLPTLSLHKKRMELPGAPVDHVLLCQQIEALLHDKEAQGYDLFSMNSTHTTPPLPLKQGPTRAQNPFLKQSMLTNSHQGKEAFIFVFKKQN